MAWAGGWLLRLRKHEKSNEISNKPVAAASAITAINRFWLRCLALSISACKVDWSEVEIALLVESWVMVFFVTPGPGKRTWLVWSTEGVSRIGKMNRT